jgi:lantibiotic modifying enzyme
VILDKAEAFGCHLLEKREANKSGFRAWPTLDKRHLTGFSHGAAGIAFALLRLYRETGEGKYYDAAQEAINFENHLFAPGKNNWPDHMELKGKGEKETGPSFSLGWCRGAPGIGLARLGALDILDSQNIRNDIRCALITTDQMDTLPRDHLCCGNAGLTEALLVAGIKLHDPEYARKAVRIMSDINGRIKRGSTGVTFRNGFYSPSLFQGAAGVGYQFLRLACPDKIPSVLLLE